MDAHDLYDAAWMRWAMENLDPPERERLIAAIGRERCEADRQPLLGDSLLLSQLGLVPRNVSRLS